MSPGGAVGGEPTGQEGFAEGGLRTAVGRLGRPSVEDVKDAFGSWLKGSEADGEVSFSMK